MTVWSLLKHCSLENSKYQFKTKATVLILSLLLGTVLLERREKVGILQGCKVSFTV
jgi:hypothetical protein